MRVAVGVVGASGRLVGMSNPCSCVAWCLCTQPFASLDSDHDRLLAWATGGAFRFGNTDVRGIQQRVFVNLPTTLGEYVTRDVG